MEQFSAPKFSRVHIEGVNTFHYHYTYSGP